MAQQRIRELTTYTQKEVGDPDYVAPDSIYVALDSNNFSGDALKFVFSDLMGSSHIEKGRLTGLSSRSVSVTFDTAFSSTPITTTLRVFRYYEYQSGKYTIQQVQNHFTSATPVTTSGFSLEVETSENLTGIIIEYEFKEP